MGLGSGMIGGFFAAIALKSAKFIFSTLFASEVAKLDVFE